MPEFTGHKDLRAYLRMVWRWKLLIIVILVAAPAVAYFAERGKPHIYQSSVLVAVDTASSSSGGTTFTTSNIDTIAALVNTTPVADLAGDLLRPKVPGSEIVGEVSANPSVTTGLLTITATDRSPARAAAIANAFANALGENQYREEVAQTRSNIAALQAQIDALPRNSPARQPLEQTISQAKAQLKTQTQGAQILQAATPNYTPVGPHLHRTVELGFVIGLLLAFAVVMLAEGADRRMRSPDDLESLTDLALLAAIAPTAFSSELQTTHVDDEAFHMLRTALTYFTVDKPLHSVMFTSPGEKEGKSTVASRLALASAQAGLNVILVDADLRRAGASEKFGLRGQTGLGAVLADLRPAEAAMVDWPLREEGAGRLRILPAGPPPPNPTALISSEAMRTLLRSLEAQSDLVIVDSPAALAVSDAVPLMHAVSGVVLVARMNHSNRDTIHRLHKIIEAAHGRILGVVATGVTAGPGYEKYSQEYYATVGDNGSRKGARKDKNKGSGGGVKLAQADTRPASGERPLPAADKA
jgi:capsular exopolysaccharide synthesis family protein